MPLESVRFPIHRSPVRDPTKPTKPSKPSNPSKFSQLSQLSHHQALQTTPATQHSCYSAKKLCAKSAGTDVVVMLFIKSAVLRRFETTSEARRFVAPVLPWLSPVS